MARLTRLQEKKHDEALSLLSLNRKLKDEETEFVFRHYSAMATHRVAKGAIRWSVIGALLLAAQYGRSIVTPYEIASELAVMARLQGGGRVIDYAAGIGVLTHHMLISEYWDAKPKHHVCVEIDPEFVEVGKKLLPRVEWVCGNIFDRDLVQSLGTFTMGIANPPFGAVPSLASGKEWLKAKVPAHLATVELMVRMCQHGGCASCCWRVIMPRVDQEYQPQTGRLSDALQRLLTAFPGLHVGMCMDLDWDQYPKWQGANPDTVIVDVSVNDVDDSIPLGFADVNQEPLAGPTAVSADIPQQLALSLSA